MGRALEDIGLLMQMVIAMDVVILERSDLLSVTLVAANQPNDGNDF